MRSARPLALLPLLVLAADATVNSRALAEDTWKVPPRTHTVTSIPRHVSLEEEALIRALHEARQSGDDLRAQAIQRELGWFDPEQPAMCGQGKPAEQVVRESLSGQGARWQDDIQVSDSSVGADDPRIASRDDGTLYVACTASDLRNYLDVYTSDNDGYTWEYWFSLMGHELNLTHPSIAVTEGNSSQLLIAYEKGQGTPDCEIWVHILYLGTSLGIARRIAAYPLDHRWPRICVDYPEYDYWYPYIVYASETAGDPDYWFIQFRRSFDYGDTWTDPQVLATVYNTGDYGPIPDIDFGDSQLYAVYDRSNVLTDKRDVYVQRSVNLGGSWDPEVGLATTEWDESAPIVAATNGGGAVVVGYNRLYESPTMQYDIELYYSTNQGDSWSWDYLPYNEYDEWGLELCVSPVLGRIHASFYRRGDIIYTWADHTSPWSWAAATDINEGSYASGSSQTGITVNPTKALEACVAWGDFRSWQYLIYFDALYTFGPAADAADEEAASLDFDLRSVPEPMSGAGAFFLDLRAAGHVQVSIHDLQGRRIQTLLDRWIECGGRQINWDGRDALGLPVPSGIYYAYLRQAGVEVRRRFTMIR